MKQNIQPSDDPFYAIVKNQLSRSSHKTKKSLVHHKFLLKILRSLKPLVCDRREMMMKQKKQQNFDKIITRFEQSKIVDNSKYPNNRSLLLDGRIVHRQKDIGSSVNHSVYTSRMQQNLSDLRSHYKLPPITTRVADNKQATQSHFHQDYSKFDPDSKKSKQRKPLGMLIMKKFKSNKTESDL